MTDDDDLEEVKRHVVPPHLAEQLLDGVRPADDIPEHLDDVDRLLRGLRTPGTDAELAEADAAVAAFRDVVLTPATVTRRTSVRYRTAKAIGIAAIATLSVGAAAAAATGRLPVVQDAQPASPADETSTTVATTVPVSTTTDASTTTAPAESTTTAAPESTTTAPDASTTIAPSTTTTPPTSSTDVTSTTGVQAPRAVPVGPDPTGPAHHGLCTAYLASRDHGGKNPDAIAFRNLNDAAVAAGQTVDEFCADVAEATPASTPDDADDPDSTPDATAPGAEDDHGRPDDAGKPDNPGKPADAGKPDNPGKPSD